MENFRMKFFYLRLAASNEQQEVKGKVVIERGRYKRQLQI